MESEDAETLLNSIIVDETSMEPILPALRNGTSSGVKAKVIEEGFAIENFETKLAQVRDALENLKKDGFTTELLKIYVRHKAGITSSDYDRVFGAMQDFFRQLK